MNKISITRRVNRSCCFDCHPSRRPCSRVPAAASMKQVKIISFENFGMNQENKERELTMGLMLYEGGSSIKSSFLTTPLTRSFPSRTCNRMVSQIVTLNEKCKQEYIVYQGKFFSLYTDTPQVNRTESHLNNITFLRNNPFNENIFICVTNVLENWWALEDHNIVCTRLSEIVCNLKDSSQETVGPLGIPNYRMRDFSSSGSPGHVKLSLFILL